MNEGTKLCHNNTRGNMKTVLIVHKQISLFQLTKIYTDTPEVSYKFFSFKGDVSRLKSLEYDEVLYFNTKDICPVHVKDAIKAGIRVTPVEIVIEEVKLEEDAPEEEVHAEKEESVKAPQERPKRARRKRKPD